MNIKNQRFSTYKKLYKDNLLNDVIPFWEKYSKDEDFGGYYTCLRGNGDVYDTDKFVWLQCRQVWTFAKLYNEVENNKQWLDFAKHGSEFLEKYGRSAKGDWYFSLDRKGAPLTQPYNIFSDCFATMAYGQLEKATGERKYAQIAKETFNSIISRQTNSKGKYDKSFPGTRDLENFALPMILSNLVLEIEHLLDKETVNDHLINVKDKILNTFYKAEYGIILENVGKQGELVDSFKGRLVNPGHGLEAMWFLMDVGVKTEDKKLIEQCVGITLSTLEYGWDKDNGGLFYFLDVKGHPPEQLEWDQKLWWPHIEAMIACLKGYYLTGNKECWTWFEKLHEYTWNSFVDKQNGEWYGYLNREGKVFQDMKGGKWKGCFHVPRGMFLLWRLMEKLEKKYSANPLYSK